MIYPFTEAPKPLDNIKEDWAVKLHQSLEAVSGSFKRLDNEHKEYLQAVFNELHNPLTYRTGIYKVMGYIVDFRLWLSTYWVQTKHSGIIEVKAFNKTMVRTLSSTPSAILKIIQVD
ncbi:hypothetical protein IAQ67_28590 (plasmid) [Paenibacillus peoriae]|uniref:Uncharacterized protein n=1 Tax=Paenibacillus peoriae TaxID=59893 RepID=A0A7H0YHB3_9BACL|nr:hypothetical protein [Paenibacillus peoriae]QNR70471.1 hypothetical protein IAQ67_28590 [Paenibacillus peoriae]